MIIRSYSKFIKENVQQAKIFLKKRESERRKSKLTPEQEKEVENNPDFIKIKNLLQKKAGAPDMSGYVYLFTKFFFDQNIDLESLKLLYEKLIKYKHLLGNLPMQIDKYADILGDSSDKRDGFERLTDDINQLELSIITKKFVDRLPNDFVVKNPNAKDYGATIPSFKKAYENAPKEIKDKVAGIAKAFDEFGKSSNGTMDLNKNKDLQSFFFKIIKRYRSLNEVIKAALLYIKSANNSQISDFFQQIEKTNQKFGERNGAEIVYYENNILILEIKSFQANKELNSNTSHCIKDSISYWNSYVGGDSNYNKQYYIYNFNLSSADNKSVIGITISPKDIRACHLKNDASFSSEIHSYMNSIKVPFSVLAPMSQQEIEIKKKRVIANKTIVKKDITIEDIRKCILDGADPNTDEGKPLLNAVLEDNIEKVRYLIDQGASPNIGDPIRDTTNFDIIKILVEHGAEVNYTIFSNICDNYEGVKYLLNHGLDVNTDFGAPLRCAINNQNIKVIKLLVEYGANLDIKNCIILKKCVNLQNIEMINYIFDKADLSKIDQANMKSMFRYLFSSDSTNMSILKVCQVVISKLVKYESIPSKVICSEIDAFVDSIDLSKEESEILANIYSMLKNFIPEEDYKKYIKKLKS